MILNMMTMETLKAHNIVQTHNFYQPKTRVVFAAGFLIKFNLL